MKKILKDMSVLKEAGIIARDIARMGAVKELLFEIKTGNVNIKVKNLKGGIHL